MPIRMIVTDLDGTLLRPDKTISPRTARALEAACEAGLFVLAATGRSIVDVGMLPPVIADLVVCSNGAVTYDAASDRVLAERTIAPEVLERFIAALDELAPGTRYAALVNGGYDLLPGPGYVDLMQPGDHGRDRATLTEVPLTEVTGQPAVKLVARQGTVHVDRLYELAQQVAHVGVLPTTSGVPFVEMSAAGVSKATTLAGLAADRGIDAGEVAVFGDSANDVEMLAWAGYAVAMGNAVPAAMAVADEVAPTNVEDGVAVVLERILAEEA